MGVGTYDAYIERMKQMKPNIYLNGECVTMKELLYRQPEGFKVHLARFTASGDAEALRERLMGGESWEAAVSGDAMASRDVISVTDNAVFLSGSAFDVGPLAPMKSLDIGQVSPVLELASSDFAVGLKSERVEERITPYDEVSADVRVLLRTLLTSVR